MLWIILGFVVCVVGDIVSSWDYIKDGRIDFSDWIRVLIDGIVGAFVGAVIWCVVGLPLGLVLPKTFSEEEQPIYALADNSATEGAHYLFSGYVEEKPVYRYVVNTERGKQIKQVDASIAYFNEGDYEQPYMITYTSKFKSNFYWWIAIHDSEAFAFVEFYVPANTIATDYNVDLQ